MDANIVDSAFHEQNQIFIDDIIFYILRMYTNNPIECDIVGYVWFNWRYGREIMIKAYYLPRVRPKRREGFVDNTKAELRTPSTKIRSPIELTLRIWLITLPD